MGDDRERATSERSRARRAWAVLGGAIAVFVACSEVTTSQDAERTTDDGGPMVDAQVGSVGDGAAGVGVDGGDASSVSDAGDAGQATADGGDDGGDGGVAGDDSGADASVDGGKLSCGDDEGATPSDFCIYQLVGSRCSVGCTDGWGFMCAETDGGRRPGIDGCVRTGLVVAGGFEGWCCPPGCARQAPTDLECIDAGLGPKAYVCSHVGGELVLPRPDCSRMNGVWCCVN